MEKMESFVYSLTDISEPKTAKEMKHSFPKFMLRYISLSQSEY